VPDAISALNPSTGVLQSIAEGKLREVAAQAASLVGETFSTSRSNG
jgi:hypothetical protein